MPLSCVRRAPWLETSCAPEVQPQLVPFGDESHVPACRAGRERKIRFQPRAEFAFAANLFGRQQAAARRERPGPRLTQRLRDLLLRLVDAHRQAPQIRLTIRWWPHVLR